MAMPDRPLGRGLADISYLFLSQRADVPAQTDDALTRGPASHTALGSSQATERGLGAEPRLVGSESGILALRPGPSLDKERLALATRELAGVLEEGMRGIDASVACDAETPIDVVAIDRANQLTIVDLATDAGEGLLLRGMAHVDWVARNMPTLRRLYGGRQHIVASGEPRLVLVAPRFSPVLLRVVKQIAHVPVSCFTYHVADVFGRAAILFEPVS